MLEDWETEPAVYDDDQGETTPNCHPRRNRERFSTPHTARDSNKIQEVELESEDLQGMIRQPPKVRAIRFHHEPESSNTSLADVTVTPPFFSNARRRTKITWGVLDDSPAIVNWNGLDPTEQAEITPTLETSNTWIMFTHPLARRMLPLPLPRYRKAPREYFIRKAKPAGREGGGGRERTNLPRTA